MYALGHRRLISLALVASGLLLLNASGSAARPPNPVWRLVDPGSNGQQDPTRPAPRKHHSLIYDAAMKRIILFGGDKKPSGAHSDVWAYPLPCGPWTKLFEDDATDCSSTERLCGRHGHAATYLPATPQAPPRMLIHGGKQADNCVANDTWQLTLDSYLTWTRLWVADPEDIGTSDPWPRWHSAMVCYNGTAYFYGGATTGGSCGGFGSGMCDMWSFVEGAQGWYWDWESGERAPLPEHGGFDHCLPSGNVPELRYHHSLTVDTKNNRFVTFGGVYDGGIGTSNAWAGPSWARLGPYNGDVPPPSTAPPQGFNRALHTATYDPIGERMIVIGGYYEDDGEAEGNIPKMVNAITSMTAPHPLPVNESDYGMWSTLMPAGTGPGKIAEHAAVYDPVGDRILVFGGLDQNGDFRNDLWALEFDPISVGALEVSPSPPVELVGQSGGVMDPNGVVCVHVKENGLPKSGVLVELEFEQLEEAVIALSQPEMQLVCSSQRISSTTDASGNARIHILGGSNLVSSRPSGSNPALSGFLLYANGTSTGKYVPYRSFDLTGDKAVDPNDLSVWLAIEGSEIYCPVVDYDGDGMIDDDDMALWLERSFAGTSYDPGGANCGGGGGANLQPAPAQIETAALLTGITGVRPTPTSGTVAVEIELAQAEGGRPLDLKVYDVVGRLVRTLPGQGLGAGRHSIRWDTRDESGQQVKAGIYIVRLQAGSKAMKRQVVVVR